MDALDVPARLVALAAIVGLVACAGGSPGNDEDGVAGSASDAGVEPAVVYLVRHAKAGERTTWEGDDRMRPLTKREWAEFRENHEGADLWCTNDLPHAHVLVELKPDTRVAG